VILLLIILFKINWLVKFYILWHDNCFNLSAANHKYGNKMKLSNILSTSVALTALTLTANSFAAPTYSGLQSIFNDTTDVRSTLAIDALNSDNFVDVTPGFTTTDGGAAAYNVYGYDIDSTDTFGIFSMTSGFGYSLIGAGSGALSGNTFDISTAGDMDYFSASGFTTVAGFGQQFGFFFMDASTSTTAWTSNAGEVLGYSLYDIDVDYGSWISGAVGVFTAEDDDWILAFNTTSTDGGYTDAVVLIEDVSLIPEPSIIALLGLGLVGMGVARRKIKAA
jgi:hypothetical protein